MVQVLSGAKNAGYHAILNQDGSGSFKIHRSDPDALTFNILQGGIDGYIVHLLRRSPLAAAGETNVDRFAFVVEAIDYSLDEKEETGGWITVAGRGTLCLLEDRVAYPPGYDGISQSTISSQWQIYAGVAAGAIMTGEIDRSNGRFAVALAHTVSQATALQTLKLRFDNLRKLHDYLVVNAPMDAMMAGLDYQSFDALGTDRSAQVTVALSARDSLRQFKLQRDSRPIKNYIVAGGTGEGINQLLVSASDALSITAFRRREGYLAMAQDDTAAQLTADATGAIRQFKTADLRIACLFMDSQLTQVYRDFGMGDTINSAVALLNFSAKYRIVGIQVADLDSENEEIHLDLNSMQQEYLLSLAKSSMITADSLNVISRMPQGAAFNDILTYPANCDATHPFRFKAFIPSNVLKMNYAKLSFFLEAFDADVSAAAGTSVPHQHQVDQVTIGLGTPTTGPASAGTAHTHGFTWPGQSQVDGGHTHIITLTYGVFEGAAATGVTVKINGVDRTTALGGGAGFTTDQTELEISQYLTIGIKNTIDLTPTGPGRILAHLRLTGYLQSV
jgi:hypothetical protein